MMNRKNLAFNSEKEFLESFNSAEKISFKKNELFYEKGHDHSYVYYITKGAIRVRDGSKVFLYLKEHQFFPLMVNGYTSFKTDYDYDALTEGEGYRVLAEEFVKVVNQNHGVLKKVLSLFMQLAADLMERLKVHQLPYTYKRLLKTLPYLTSKFGSYIKGSIFKIPKMMTQKELSLLLGTTRESVTKSFQKAKRDHVITVDRKGMEVDLSKVMTPEEYESWEDKNFPGLRHKG